MVIGIIFDPGKPPAECLHRKRFNGSLRATSCLNEGDLGHLGIDARRKLALLWRYGFTTTRQDRNSSLETKHLLEARRDAEQI